MMFEDLLDDYKAWYEEAMGASIEAGFVGFSAAQTIRELSTQLAGAVTAERERCAALCDAVAERVRTSPGNATADSCARRIRGGTVMSEIERFKFELRQAIIEYGSAIKADDSERILETTTQGAALIEALSLQPAPAAQEPPVCQTCNGRGMIGGPSFRAPDEGGVPCPDCDDWNCLESQFLGLMEGDGASEDHEDCRDLFRRAGFKPETIELLMQAIVNSRSPPAETKIQQRHKYECLIAVRPTYKGRPAKPAAAALNGKMVTLEALWVCNDADPYPGEWAMGLLLREYRGEDGPCWLASGDLKILREIDPLAPAGAVNL